MVGMEDSQHPGKLRKYQCCPVKSSKSNKKSKLARGVAFVGDEEDCEENFTRDDDFVDDDDDDDDHYDDDDPHDAPPTPPATSSPIRPAASQHATTQTFDYVSDDEFVSGPICSRRNVGCRLKRSSAS